MATSGRKEKLVSELSKQLTAEQKRLLQLISIENRKEKLLFRMPRGVVSLDEVWQKIVSTCETLGFAYARTDPFATLEELDELLDDVKWEWPAWLPRGFVTTQVGDPGVGKSMLVLDLVRIITTGDVWPMTDLRAEIGNVVWIESEASQQLLNIRSKKLKVCRNKVYMPVIDGDVLSQPDIGIEEHREQIVNLVIAKKPSLVVLDSLGGSHSRGENKVEEMRPVMEFFALLARDYNTSVIVTHHLNKGYEKDSTEISLYRMRGSTIIPAMSRTILALERVKDDALRLRMIKSNLSRIPEPLSVVAEFDTAGDINKMNYSMYSAPPAKKTKKEQCASWVMEMLKDAGEGGMKLVDLCDIGEGHAFTRGNIYSAKEALGDRIYISGNGRMAIWHLNDNNDIESIDQITRMKQ